MTVNSTNSANCVIPKRESLTVWTPRRVVQKTSKKKSRVARAAGGQTRKREVREEDDAPPHAYALTPPSSRPERNTGNLFPQVSSCVTSRRLQSTAIPPCLLLLPPSIFSPTRCNTQHLHTILISYLSTARSVCASLHAHERTFRVYRVI